MKAFFKRLYFSSPACYNVWTYLWLTSDEKNETVFEYSELQGRFKIATSSLYRHLKIDKYVGEKIYVEVEKISAKKAKVKFYPNGKRKPKKQKTLVDLKLWIKNYYLENEIDYVDFLKHERFVDNIHDKMKKAIKAKDPSKCDENTVSDTVMFMFTHLPEWWKENAFTLPSINKNFTKILNQIKQSRNGRQGKKYAITDSEIERINFS